MTSAFESNHKQEDLQVFEFTSVLFNVFEDLLDSFCLRETQGNERYVKEGTKPNYVCFITFPFSIKA